MGLQNMPLWHIDYYELKALEKEQIQEELSDLSFCTPKQVIKFLMRKVTLYQEEKNILVSQRLGINVEVDLYKQTYSNDVILYSTGFPPTPFMSYCLPHNVLPLAQTLLPFLHKSIISWSKI